MKANPLFNLGRLAAAIAFLVAFVCQLASAGGQSVPPTLPGTSPLRLTGEIDRQLIAGVDHFLDRQLKESPQRRMAALDALDPAQWPPELERRRQRLRYILGVRDRRPQTPMLELVATPDEPAVVASAANYEVLAVRWHAFGNVWAEGLLMRPKQSIVAQMVAVPDADQTPELLAGIGLDDTTATYPQLLASRGCQVLIPTIISRQRDQFSWHGRRVDISNREFLYRPAFVLGRHLIGYEVQKIMAAVDWFHTQHPNLPLGVVGWGEGGGIALYSSALDDRIQITCVSGYFEPRERVWQQPIDRNVFGLLEQFGDAELAVMLAPRQLIIEASAGPEVELSGGGGAPGQLSTPDADLARQEFERAKHISRQLHLPTKLWDFVDLSEEASTAPFSQRTKDNLIKRLVGTVSPIKAETLRDKRKDFRPEDRMHRQMRQINDHSQSLLRESPYVRQEFMQELDKQSLAEFEAAQPAYRERFASNVIGRFDIPLLPPNARTRLAYEEEKWIGYEVVLDVYPDVIAHGLLLLPRGLDPNEKRPVVVCQHGLEGRPQDVIGAENYHYYKAFAAKLAERGFITFAPQNLYRHHDAFRVLQRKANPLGKTLFSIIAPQHQQILNWLKTQPHVDPDRIAFYGLSYGGKTAMRVPALLTDYCLSICSADFNEWVMKNASTRSPYSYVWTGEYEIFEWDLGSTFNYSEMAALIAPRPFMVERGHDDGVSADETVAYEFAKVRRRYVKLGIGDRCEIEWFNGPHTINGKGTFAFLHRHLQWPRTDP